MRGVSQASWMILLRGACVQDAYRLVVMKLACVSDTEIIAIETMLGDKFEWRSFPIVIVVAWWSVELLSEQVENDERRIWSIYIRRLPPIVCIKN